MFRQPLENGNAANIAASEVESSQTSHALSTATALPDSLLIPEKESATPGFVKSASTLFANHKENTPPHVAVTSSDIATSDQHTLSGVSTTTPTTIFGRLRTRSPSVSSTVPSLSGAPPQPVYPVGIEGHGSLPLPVSTMASQAQKRARPVQRGVHPAEINKRITNAQECWHILDIVNNFGAEFDAVNVATALHRIAKQRPDDAKKLVASNTFKQLVMMVDVQV